MGGTTSKVTTDVTNKAITDFTMELAKECSAGASNNIVFEFGDVGGDFNLTNSNFEQSATVNFTCIQDTMTEAQISQKMAAYLSQQSETEGNPLALPWGGVSSDQRIKLYNEVVQKLNMKDIQQCAANASNNFEARAEKVGGNVVIDNITMKQVTEVISNCKQISDMSAKMAAEINSKVDQKGDTQMASWLEGLLGPMGGLIAGASVSLCFCCCLMLLIAIGIFMFNRPKSPGEMLLDNVSGEDAQAFLEGAAGAGGNVDLSALQ